MNIKHRAAACIGTVSCLMLACCAERGLPGQDAGLVDAHAIDAEMDGGLARDAGACILPDVTGSLDMDCGYGDANIEGDNYKFCDWADGGWVVHQGGGRPKYCGVELPEDPLPDCVVGQYEVKKVEILTPEGCWVEVRQDAGYCIHVNPYGAINPLIVCPNRMVGMGGPTDHPNNYSGILLGSGPEFEIASLFPLDCSKMEENTLHFLQPDSFYRLRHGLVQYDPFRESCGHCVQSCPTKEDWDKRIPALIRETYGPYDGRCDYGDRGFIPWCYDPSIY